MLEFELDKIYVDMINNIIYIIGQFSKSSNSIDIYELKGKWIWERYLQKKILK